MKLTENQNSEQIMVCVQGLPKKIWRRWLLVFGWTDSGLCFVLAHTRARASPAAGSPSEQRPGDARSSPNCGRREMVAPRVADEAPIAVMLHARERYVPSRLDIRHVEEDRQVAQRGALELQQGAGVRHAHG